MNEHKIEVERKYDITPKKLRKLQLTTLQDVTLGEPEDHAMTAVYYDTEGQDLMRAKVAVRRRQGGADDGWHVKYDAGSARGELHYEPLKTSERMPAAARKPLRGVIGEQELSPLATVSTHRTVYPVLDADGMQVAELCLDTVDARDERTGTDRQWSECEVEITAEGLRPKAVKAVFSSVEEMLFAGGAVPSASPAKIARALGLDEQPADEARPENGKQVFTAMCELLVGRIVQWDFAVRVEAHDAIHQLRVAVRSLRGVLHASRQFLPQEYAVDLEQRMRDTARVLGVARDEEVTRQQLEPALDDQFPGMVSPMSRQDLLDVSDAFAAEAAREVRRMMDGPEYARLLADLRELASAAPVSKKARKLSAKDFSKRVLEVAVQEVIERSTIPEDVTGVTVTDLGREVGQRVATGEQDPHRLAVGFDVLHDARKAAKALRYVTESLTAVGAKPGKKRSKAATIAKSYQQDLGDITDSAVMEDWLTRAASRMLAAHRDRYVLGLLHARHLRQLRTDLADGPELLADLVSDLRGALKG